VNDRDELEEYYRQLEELYAYDPRLSVMESFGSSGGPDGARKAHRRVALDRLHQIVLASLESADRRCATCGMGDAHRRLDAIAGVDWGEVTYTPHEVERYCHWVDVGPVMMPAARPEDERPEHRAEALEDKRRQDAIVDFLRHAAGDLRVLLGGDQCTEMTHPMHSDGTPKSTMGAGALPTPGNGVSCEACRDP